MVESGVDDCLMQMLPEAGSACVSWGRAVARFPESEKVGGHQVKGWGRTEAEGGGIMKTEGGGITEGKTGKSWNPNVG